MKRRSFLALLSAIPFAPLVARMPKETTAERLSDVLSLEDLRAKLDPKETVQAWIDGLKKTHESAPYKSSVYMGEWKWIPPVIRK